MDAKRSHPSDRELRCPCGSLLARMTVAGVELKCRRCRRIVVVPVPPPDGRWVEVTVA
jgi:phage FluMu protein Com